VTNVAVLLAAAASLAMECLGMMQQGKAFEDFPHLAQAAKKLLDEMSWWAKVLKLARQSMTTGVAA
jgi:hypothetical protein